MRVGFEMSTVAFEQKTGTGVYCEEFVKAYQRNFQQDEILHTYRLSRWMRGYKYFLPLQEKAKRAIVIDPLTCYLGWGLDIYHGLNSRLPFLLGTKKVATIHDLFSILGKFSKKSFRKRQSEKLMQMIDRADHIIVPASYTKGQLVNLFGFHENKISVVPEGVRQVFLKDHDKSQSKNYVRENFKINTNYILFVGTLERRKNVAGLMRAYAKLCAQFKDAPDLVLVGNKGFGYTEIEAEINNSGIKDKIIKLGFVTEEGLRHLYTACELFAFLSFEEGFGIPVIEAMACGAPVLTSDTTSLPEAGGGHTWLVDPENHDLIAKTMLDILKNKYFEKVKAGQTYARTQTWDMVAKKTREVYLQQINE